MTLIGLELPGDDEYPIAWLNWTTWAIWAWIVVDASRTAVVGGWIADLRQEMSLSSVDKLVNRLAERLESAWTVGGVWCDAMPGWKRELGQWRDGPTGILDAAMQLAEWQQIATRLLDDERTDLDEEAVADGENASADQPEPLIDDREQLRLLEQALQPRGLRLVPGAEQDLTSPPSETQSDEDPPDEDSFFEEMLMETSATLGWLEDEGLARSAVAEVLRADGTLDADDLVEAVADYLRDWVDKAAAPPGAARTHPDDSRVQWSDGPFPDQTFSHWLMQAVIEDIDWWLLAKLLVHRAGRSSSG